ncbi:MAG: hypothetical protein LUF33_08040 [Clostridiales bacterium]|nr:hypothetical protein [Clostridiales bacterium]
MNEENFEMTVKYFNDHYAEDDEQIEFEIVENMYDIGIYICSLKPCINKMKK